MYTLNVYLTPNVYWALLSITNTKGKKKFILFCCLLTSANSSVWLVGTQCRGPYVFLVVETNFSQVWSILTGLPLKWHLLAPIPLIAISSSPTSTWHTPMLYTAILIYALKTRSLHRRWPPPSFSPDITTTTSDLRFATCQVKQNLAYHMHRLRHSVPAPNVLNGAKPLYDFLFTKGHIRRLELVGSEYSTLGAGAVYFYPWWGMWQALIGAWNKHLWRA